MPVNRLPARAFLAHPPFSQKPSLSGSNLRRDGHEFRAAGNDCFGSIPAIAGNVPKGTKWQASPLNGADPMRRPSATPPHGLPALPPGGGIGAGVALSRHMRRQKPLPARAAPPSPAIAAPAVAGACLRAGERRQVDAESSPAPRSPPRSKP